MRKTVGPSSYTLTVYETMKNIINVITYLNNPEFLKKRQSLSILRWGDTFDLINCSVGIGSDLRHFYFLKYIYTHKGLY